MNPKETTVLAFLADYNAMSQHRQKAIDQIEQALALEPEDGEVKLRAAIVNNQLGDTEWGPWRRRFHCGIPRR